MTPNGPKLTKSGASEMCGLQVQIIRRELTRQSWDNAVALLRLDFTSSAKIPVKCYGPANRFVAKACIPFHNMTRIVHSTIAILSTIGKEWIEAWMTMRSLLMQRYRDEEWIPPPVFRCTAMIDDRGECVVL